MFKFKKKLTAYEAANTYIMSLIKVLDATQENDYRIINEICERFETPGLEEFKPAFYQFEIMLAIIPLEFQVIKNTAPEKYIMLTDAVYKVLPEHTAYQEATDYALESIQKLYLPEIEQVIRENLPPWDGVLDLLLAKLNIEFNSIIATQLAEILLSKTGGWKALLNDYKIVK